MDQPGERRGSAEDRAGRDLGRTVSETGEGEAGVMSDPQTGIWPRHFNDGVLFTSTGNPGENQAWWVDLKLPTDTVGWGSP